MLFSSTVFLFQFLPCALLVYALAFRSRGKRILPNALLLVISLVFYFLGNGQLLLLLCGSIGWNYSVGNVIAPASSPGMRRAWLAAGIAINLALLFYFKYTGFFLASAASGLQAAGLHAAVPAFDIALPVGISFYTFMAISYLMETYEGAAPARSLLDFAMYLSLFPHLVAGPIVRFSELRDEIGMRSITMTGFVEGMYRFSIGLARKVIVADSLAGSADKIFALPPGSAGPALAWTGAVCYAFQIFYDFAGYTDMAVGLAKMFGFNFPENFAQPYTASNVTAFWRRWHMSLTRWFRDFLYIPLGGNRRGALRTYVNLLVVFILCGLWHGAAWTFVAWGIYHGLFLVAERVLEQRLKFRTAGFAGIAFTFLVVTVGWVFFRSTSIGAAFVYIATMFGLNGAGTISAVDRGSLLNAATIGFIVIAAAFAFVPLTVQQRLTVRLESFPLKGPVAIAALLLAIAYVSEGTFRPFVYFRF